MFRYRNCFVQVGQPGRGGNGDNGSVAKGLGRGGDGGNGGVGGDLRASNAYAGGLYFGDNANVVIDGCVFDNCRGLRNYPEIIPAVMAVMAVMPGRWNVLAVMAATAGRRF